MSSHIRQYVLSLMLLLSIAMSGAHAGNWQTLTSMRDIRQLRVIDDTLYVATSGGLLAISSFDDPGKTYLNTDGLGTTNITDMIIDAEGVKWLTGFGRLIRFGINEPEQFLFQPANGKLFLLTRLVDDGDNLWVGTDSGLVLFSKVNDGGQIEEHLQLTTVNAFPKVNDILLLGDSIWVATSSGLLVADKRSPDLPPAAWTLFSVNDFPELRSDTVRKVVYFEQDIYVATSHGFFQLSRTTNDTTFVPMSIAFDKEVNDLVIEGDSLFIYYVNGIGVLTASGPNSININGLPSAPKTGIGWNGTRWVSSAAGGLYAELSGQFEEYPFTGAPANDVQAVAVDGEHHVVAGFGKITFARFDGTRWERYNFTLGDKATSAITDATGDVWAGTWGNGVWKLRGDSEVNYDENNSSCRGIPTAEFFVVVQDMASDGEHIFILCDLTYNNFPVAVGRLDNLDDIASWDSIGIAEGITNNFVNTIGYGGGQIAVGTKSAGLFLCNVDDALADNPTACVHYTKENSTLLSNTIRIIRYSPRGNAWVGTNFGLSRWDPGIERFVDVTLPAGIGPEVTALEFDGRGNLWVGSRNGLARFDGATGEATVYTETSSYLVSNDIRDLALDQTTGDLYIATGSGISVLTSEVRKRTAVLDSIAPVPNPFIIRSDNDRLEFNFSRAGTVRIYTVAGEPVTEYPVNIPWDGRNQSGEKVASGVYLYILTDTDGNIAKGKLLLIRE